jgi:hypothetical protein
MVKWEYDMQELRLHSLDKETLNKRGVDGWELCGLNKNSTGNYESWQLVFKRQIEAKRKS